MSVQPPQSWADVAGSDHEGLEQGRLLAWPKTSEFLTLFRSDASEAGGQT